MATKDNDNWSTEAYQSAASFVPKLAGKVMGWLDVQKDDAVLDIGCGDGVIDLQLANVLAQGSGRLHGIDNSVAMIAAAEKAARDAGMANSSFEVCDCNDLAEKPELKGQYSKAFSNAAMHWILGHRDPARHEHFFRGVHAALKPGGLFAFEMGGLGNVSELLTGIVYGVSQRIGMAATQAANPWFFPDEAWARDILESRVGGWKIEMMEREWRETPADAGGVDGWIRLMARPFLDAIPDAAVREAATREIVNVLEYTTKRPDGSHCLQYVRLRVLARRL